MQGHGPPGERQHAQKMARAATPAGGPPPRRSLHCPPPTYHDPTVSPNPAQPSPCPVRPPPPVHSREAGPVQPGAAAGWETRRVGRPWAACSQTPGRGERGRGTGRTEGRRMIPGCSGLLVGTAGPLTVPEGHFRPWLFPASGLTGPILRGQACGHWGQLRHSRSKTLRRTRVAELTSENGRAGGLGFLAQHPLQMPPLLCAFPPPSAFRPGRGRGSQRQGCHSSAAHRMSGGSRGLGSPLPVRLWPAWTL